MISFVPKCKAGAIKKIKSIVFFSYGQKWYGIKGGLGRSIWKKQQTFKMITDYHNHVAS